MLVHGNTLVYWLFYDGLLSCTIVNCLQFVRCNQKCTISDEGHAFLVPIKHTEKVQEVSLRYESGWCIQRQYKGYHCDMRVTDAKNCLCLLR